MRSLTSRFFNELWHLACDQKVEGSIPKHVKKIPLQLCLSVGFLLFGGKKSDKVKSLENFAGK
jgi:hypothetical protein